MYKERQGGRERERERETDVESKRRVRECVIRAGLLEEFVGGLVDPFGWLRPLNPKA